MSDINSRFEQASIAAKYKVWERLNGLDKDRVKLRYIDLVLKLGGTFYD